VCAELRTAFSGAGVRRLLAVIVATLSVSVAASAQTAAGGGYHSLVLKSDRRSVVATDFSGISRVRL
jgi:hypothetical protein